MSKAKDAIRAATEYTVDPVTGDIYGKKGQKLEGTVASNGYRYVSLFIKGVTDPKRGLQVGQHNMVAYCKYGEAAFAPGIETRHKDGNRLNNTPNNILIGTRLENIMDMAPEQRSAKCKDKPSKKRMLSSEQVQEIRDVYARGLIWGECTKLAKKFGVTSTTVSEIGKGHTYNA